MAEIIEFRAKKHKKPRIPTQPTKLELYNAREAIANDTWNWGYVIDVFLKHTNKGVTESKLRALICRHFPMCETEEFKDNNTNAYRSVIFTPNDRNIDVMNEVLDDLDGDWELNLHLPYFLKTDYEKDEAILRSFLDEVPEMAQWQVAAGWYDLR